MTQPPQQPLPPRGSGGWRPPPRPAGSGAGPATGPAAPPSGTNPFGPAPAGGWQGTPRGKHPGQDPLGWGPTAPPTAAPVQPEFHQPARPTQQFGPSQQYGTGRVQDPTQAFGAPPPAHVSIDQFTEPKTKANWIIGGIVGLVIVALVVTALMLRNSGPLGPSTSPTPSPPASPSVVPSAVAAGRAIPWESKFDNAKGYWEITSQQWTSDGLQVTMLLRADQGEMQFQFFAMDSTTTQVYDPDPPAGGDDLSNGTIRAPHTLTGSVTFTLPRHTTMVVLTDSLQRQVAVLAIKA